MKKQILFQVFLLLSIWQVQATRQAAAEVDSVFKRYFDQAVSFTANYPREKAFLHLDNTSYYVGDTIWFKAYVTLAGNHRPSPISKPLYVELLDQSGYVAQKHIIKLDNGEGSGQFILDNSIMSGYYEIRAYTRWMLAFDQPGYFSRVLPIYQYSDGERPKQVVTTYNLNQAMDKRPEASGKNLAVQFFPEGGSLVEGVTSRVAFKAESRKEGHVQLKGKVLSKSGKVLADLETLHDGMGVFSYTPTKESATAKVIYNDKEHSFDLPEALSAGYALSVDNVGGGILVTVISNQNTPEDDMAVFISRDGCPYIYQTFHSKRGEMQDFLIKTRDFPGGVYQISLINKSGRTLCERFSFVQPKDRLSISVAGVQNMYQPFQPICCELQVTDKQGNPLQGTFSVSVRDAVRSDYAEYDNNLFTDMLLTSNLKGYIHQPGYYFANVTARKIQELDLVMMIHGWRQYDMSALIADTPPKLLQEPETDLLLRGQILSSILKKEKENLDITVTVKEGDDMILGNTKTGEHGRFSFPVAEFEGVNEAIFQTSSPFAKNRADRSVLIDRNFSPKPRRYAYQEWYPQWQNQKLWREMAELSDSLYIDSIRKNENLYLLDEVEITRKRKDNLTTDVFEKSVDAYYYVSQIVDEWRDQGKEVFTINQFMAEVNPDFDWNRSTDVCSYKNRRVRFVMNNHILSPMEKKMMESEIDGIERIVICEGGKAFTETIVNNSNYLINEPSGSPFMFDGKDDGLTNVSSLDHYIALYIIPHPRKDLLNNSMRAAKGTRRTFIQGYTTPLTFKPAFVDQIPEMIPTQNKRTLYWNPELETDENGKAIIECSNAQYSNPVIIQAEMMKDGVAGYITHITK